jgi:hypothetical protein
LRCSSCGIESVRSSGECESCGTPLARARYARESRPARPEGKSLRLLVVMGAVAVILTAAWGLGSLPPQCRLTAAKIVGGEIRAEVDCNAFGRWFWRPDEAFATRAIQRAFSYHLGGGGVTVRCAWPGNCWVTDKTPAARAGEPFTGR